MQAAHVHPSEEFIDIFCSKLSRNTSIFEQIRKNNKRFDLNLRRDTYTSVVLFQRIMNKTWPFDRGRRAPGAGGAGALWYPTLSLGYANRRFNKCVPLAPTSPKFFCDTSLAKGLELWGHFENDKY